MSRPKEFRSEAIQASCKIARDALLWVQGNAVGITQRANADCGEAISGRNYDGVSRGGNDSTHPERHALHSRPDDVTAAVVEFQELQRTLLRDARRFRHLGEYLSLVKTVGVSIEGQSKNIGAGDCSVCGTYCTGTRTDRLVSGRCGTCLQYWERHHREEDRPRELWGEKEPA